MEDKIDQIHYYLRNGDAKKALDELYLVCKTHSKNNLSEVVAHITRIDLIRANDRSGIISFDERIRLEAQTSAAVLNLVQIIEERDESMSFERLVKDLQIELEQERKMRVDAESRLEELNKVYQDKTKKNQNVRVRPRNFKRIQLDVIALSNSTTVPEHYAVVFKEVEGNRRLPIVVGLFEAQSMAVAMEEMIPSRPLTHDLFKMVVEKFRFSLKEVMIDDLIDGVFYSKLAFANGEDYIEVDCRTSDAVALALRFKAPIYIYDFILDAAGVIVENEEN